MSGVTTTPVGSILSRTEEILTQPPTPPQCLPPTKHTAPALTVCHLHEFRLSALGPWEQSAGHPKEASLLLLLWEISSELQ